MYIRRKMYSTYLDKNGEERLYSTTEFIDEGQYLSEALYPEERTFNSRAQKARRAKVDMKRGFNSISKDIGDTLKPNQIRNLKKASESPIVSTKGMRHEIFFNKEPVSTNKFFETVEQTDLLKAGRKANKLDFKNSKFNFGSKKYKEELAKTLSPKNQEKYNALHKSIEKAENAVRAQAKFETKKAAILKGRARVKNLKTAGKIAGGLALASGIGYGGYKYYQYKHNKKK